MKVILIDKDIDRPLLVETEGGLNEWKKLLDCDTVDIQTLSIGGIAYDFIMDDFALMGDHKRITAFTEAQEPLLVGSLIICNFDEATGEEAGLSESDIKNITEHARRCSAEIEGDIVTWAGVIAAYI